MGAALSAFKTLFPCMGGAQGDTASTITIRSTSACCRGKIVQIRLDDHQIKELGDVISKLVEQKSTEVTVV